MIQQLNQPITFEAFYVASKTGKTSLTPSVDVYDPAGTKIVSAASAIETGGGLYRYTLSNPTLQGGYKAVFHTTDTTVDQQDVPSLWEVGVGGVNNLDAAVSSRVSSTNFFNSALTRWTGTLGGNGS
jgi:hypothetical protein